MALKVLHIVILASVKYMLTLPYAMIIGMEYKYAILALLGGGIGGFLFFYYLSKRVLKGWRVLLPQICQRVPVGIKQRVQLFCSSKNKKPRKRFTRRKRFLVKIKTTYGLWGIIIATPFFLTIPVGAFLANKYYSRRKNIVFYMILSIVSWGMVYSGIILLFPRIFFQ
ncbi:hypothetical protein D1614_15180 [Maribellus luteus]|uniref:Small multi-drug export protein n=1 Tax=Maribellus luteus TaxID=2305463 RepID=A0A399SZP8_9BACT|nr:hypothetical protein [Maribellus luteus]RIJ47447.1 hypothetical protein D1614_15180 [Maribellus luteus]